MVRDDLDVPVIVVQTETDLLGHLNYLPARQPDSEWLRLWEVAGTSHADKFQIGEFEDFLGCPGPVNTRPAGVRRSGPRCGTSRPGRAAARLLRAPPGSTSTAGPS